MTIPNVVVSAPSQLFTLPNSFAAIDGGSIYIGQIDTDPTVTANQIQVYVQNDDGTTAAVSQPISIGVGGYPEYNGSVAKFVTVEGQSMAILDANGVQQFYYPDVLKYNPDQLSLSLSSSNGYSYIGTISGTLMDNINFVTPQMFINSGSYATISLAIQAMLDYALSSNKKIVAWGSSITLNTSVANNGVEWFGGEINGPSSLLMNISGNASFVETIFNGPVLKPLQGTIVVDRCNFINCTATAAILIQGLTATSTLDVVRCNFSACNFGILQQGSGSYLTRLRILDCQFRNMNGDGIELNVVNGHYADGLLIDGVLLSNINNITSQPNWGIGIGVAGAGPYAIDAPDKSYASNIVIKNVHGTGCRQLIHLEVCSNFTVEDCDLYTDTTVSTGSGLTATGVVAYGCKNFTIDNIRGEPYANSQRFIYIAWGVNSGDYTAPCRYFTIKNIRSATGVIDIATSCTDAIGNEFNIENCYVKTVKHRGIGSKMRFFGIRCNSFDGAGYYTSGEGGGVYTRNAVVDCEVIDVVAIDDSGATNGVFLNLTADRLITSGCNFDIVQNPVSQGRRGYILGNVGNEYNLSGNVFPPGREFSVNDILYKTNGGKFTIITQGAYIPPGDTLLSAPSGQNYIESSGALNWGLSTAGASPKTGGTRIIIPGGASGGANLLATITEAPSLVGGSYRVSISPPLGAAIPAGTTITAAYPVAYIEI